MCGRSNEPTAQQIYEGYKEPDKLSKDGMVLREGKRAAQAYVRAAFSQHDKKDRGPYWFQLW